MLFVQNFTVKNRNRLNKLLEFKSENLPNSEFKYEPTFSEKDGVFPISMQCDMEDLITLEALFESWKEEDKRDELKVRKLSFIDTLLHNLRA